MTASPWTALATSLVLSGTLAAHSFAQTYTEVTPPAGSVTASTHDGNVPGNTVDNDLGTRWSGQGDGHWIQYDLGSSTVLAYLRIAAYSGDTRRSRFDIQVSDDGASWSTVWVGQSSGSTTAQEHYEIADVMARHVRLLGHGNSTNAWNSFTEVDLYASSGTPEPPTPTPPPTATPPPTSTPTPTPPATATPTPTPIPPGGPRSEHVNLGEDGRLVYHPYPNGDTIPDFSTAGYMGGGVRLPNVPVRTTISPVDGDDGASIQAAIDEVSAMPLDASGHRGAVLLTAGVYDVAGSVAIRASGVVLRGEGDGPGGTLIKAVGTARRTLITVAGVGNRMELSATQRPIVDAYVPVGTRSIHVSDASGYAVGDDILVVRTPNQEWIDLTGTDACSTIGTAYDTSDINNVTCISESHWTPGSRVMKYERKIVAISGNRITVDSPMVEAFQSQFGGGHVVKYTFTGRIQQSAVESLRSESDWAFDTDENHAVRMISISNLENGWVRNVTSVYYEQGTVMVSGGSKYITVQDSQSLDHKSVVTGGRRYPFSLDDCSHILVMRCLAKTGRHDYVTGSNTPGPNVFLDSDALESRSELGPHHRWATGSLFDLILHQSTSGSQIIGAYNRGNSGSGHGWSGGYQVFWNCIGDTHRLAAPPEARQWSVGCQVKRVEGTGEFESLGNPVTPGSLYLQQLKDRLGVQALANIGYSAVLPPPPPTPTPSPTPTTPPVDPCFGPNLALGKPSSASTNWSTSFDAPKAFDGSNTSRWSAFRAAVVDQWLRVDLGAATRYSCVSIRTETRFRRVTSYVFQSSDDGATFTDIPGTERGALPAPLSTTCFEPVTSRYFRLLMRRSTVEPTINEVAVYDRDFPPELPDFLDATVEATGPDGAWVVLEGTAKDDRDGDIPIEFDPPSGQFPLGDTTVTATAKDSCGNVSKKTFVVSVVDTTPPTIDVPDDIIEEATGPDGAVVRFQVTASDLVSGAVPVNVDFPSGSTFPLGRTVVTVTASDAAENTATAHFFVEVRDRTAPVIERIAVTPNLVWPPNHKMRSVDVTVQVSEAVDRAPVTRIVSITSNEPETGAFEGDIGPDTGITGPLSAEVRAERFGTGGGRVYTITVESRDFSGNSSTATVDVKVPHSQGRR